MGSTPAESVLNALYRAENVRELDKQCITLHHIPGYTLMERAATFALRCLEEEWPTCRVIIVLCGAGNNAGDGYLLAGLAKAKGWQVTCLFLVDPETLSGDAQTAFEFACEQGVRCERYTAQAWSATMGQSSPGVVVDALLGIGLKRLVQGLFEEAITACNQATWPCLALDIPSGLAANTGQVLGVAMQAALTTSFIGKKLGLYTGQGRAYCGKIRFSTLDAPSEVYETIPRAATCLDLDTLLRDVSPRKPTAHKGQFGHSLLVGGNVGFGGAIILAAQAAARIGSGLISVATHPEHYPALLQRQPELMPKPIESPPNIKPLLAVANAVAVGPGLGQNAWAEHLALLVTRANAPCIVDADALNLLARNDEIKQAISTHKHGVIITPHPGEAARLLNVQTHEIEHDRLWAVQALADQYKATVLLKGSGSLIADPSGEVSLCPYGNAGMASGGMGDVLTGLICGLVAQRGAMQLDLRQCVELAACLHSRAADIIAITEGQIGLLAGDLTPVIRQLFNRLIQ